MKKILATLLVATMLLSCMTFVSFADTKGTAYTATTFPNNDMEAFDPDDTCEFVDALSNHYNSNMRKAFISDGSTLTAANSRKTPILAAIYGGIQDGAEYSYEIPDTATPADVVAIPVYCSEPGATAVGVKADYDANFLVPVESADICGATVAEVKDGQFVASLANADPVSGLHYVLYFKVKAGATGDENGLATTNVTLNWQNADNEFIEGNNVCAVKLSGLEKGQPAVQDKEITADDLTVAPVKALAENADAAGMEADLAKFGVAVPSDVATNKYVYNAIFATIPTTGYVAPSAYGIILNTAKGAQKVTVTNAVDGKFGVFVYGSTYALDAIESYQTFCTVNGVDVLGAVVEF